MRPDRQQNCSGLLGEGRGHKVGTSVPPGLPILVVVPTASDNPDPCVREGNQQHNCGRPVQGEGDTMAPVTTDGGQDLSAVRDPPGRPLCLQGDSSVTPVYDSPAGGQSSPGSGRSQSDVGLRPGVRLPPSDACPDGGQQAQGLHTQECKMLHNSAEILILCIRISKFYNYAGLRELSKMTITDHGSMYQIEKLCKSHILKSIINLSDPPSLPCLCLTEVMRISWDNNSLIS